VAQVSARKLQSVPLFAEIPLQTVSYHVSMFWYANNPITKFLADLALKKSAAVSSVGASLVTDNRGFVQVLRGSSTVEDAERLADSSQRGRPGQVVLYTSI